MTEESFLKNNKVLSNLKVRASYGVTGQQDGIGNYNYLPIYTISQNGAESIMGNDYIYTYRPKSYVSDLKWKRLLHGMSVRLRFPERPHYR